MEIGWIEVLKKAYGETEYTQLAQSILAQRHPVDRINVGIDDFRKVQYPKVLSRLCRVRGQKDLWVRNFDAILTMPYDQTEGRNLAMIFHIDHSFQPLLIQLVMGVLEKIFYRHLRQADAIVTISKYWQDHFVSRGYTNVHLIYNAFDVDSFRFDEEEIDQFKRKFRLDQKPIVYLGNCQRIKGVVEAYEQLKHLDLHLVTSGRREVNLPAMNLNLDYRNYLLLLKSASVVLTMSKFKEGWNRTAHEAMLCGTPVIGSGLGGMRELLEGGEQLVCDDFRYLREKVGEALHHPEVGQKGYAFAAQFGMDRFRESWLKLMDELSS